MRFAANVYLLLIWGCSCCYCAAEDTQFTLDQYYETSLEEPMIEDSAVQPAGYGGQTCMDCYSCMDCNSYAPCPQTVGWLSGPYFKLGLTSVLGTGLLEENRGTSYTISMGGRQPLGPGMGGRRLFFDVGGSYLSAEGETTRDVSGKQTNTATNTSMIVDDAFSVTLNEVRRAGAHAGVGCYFGSLLDDRTEDPQARLGLVFGGRLSHMHGVFRSQRLVTPPAGSTLTPINERSDMAGGLYLDVEALILKRNSPLGDLQWTIDGEFAQDWIEYSNFAEGGLGTASLLFGFMLVR
ncbi:hypothetical protein [Bythopirellula goksoeyrii]|uniref:Outer membrane protein beta-barrel domain-containing protein n=1 Tax=Bythopirellula goksoeyrii TaxID=1400387 RepID=A0A5B9QES9_9BACT|nr:hypothetical protein [Bythopirellula goksoeyrii]QEG32841.1 hypothetical protein Pr1d_01020 [Bythopirellula goksoeyrii]